MKAKIDFILQLLLGLAFTIFGLNKFIGFMGAPELPERAMNFFGALAETGYMVPLIGGTEVIGGVLILSRLLAPLGLLILAPVSLNIILFHVFLDPAGGVPGFVLAALNLYLIFKHCPNFKTIISQKK